MAHCYGAGNPPSLVLLQAVFMAASRCAGDSRPSPDSHFETRSHCEMLHTKLRALLEADIVPDRVATIQAALIASLHWEAREGLNSALDNLSLAVRACQEMGLHRKSAAADSGAFQMEGQALPWRIWWSVYMLHHFSAIQKGTPFLINELACDVELLTEEDFEGEDSLVRRVSLLDLFLARLREDITRNLYVPGENHSTLFSVPLRIMARELLVTRILVFSRLMAMQTHNVRRFSWHFMVYAVVNCLLIFWYDLSSPPI